MEKVLLGTLNVDLGKVNTTYECCDISWIAVVTQVYESAAGGEELGTVAQVDGGLLLISSQHPHLSWVEN